MKNLNRHIFTISIVMVMSVFFIACGIPNENSYCELTNVKVYANNKTDPQSCLTGTDCLYIYTTSDGESDLKKLTEKNPGLVLLFYQPESITEILDENVYKITSYILESPTKQSKNPVLTYDGKKFYAFYIGDSTIPVTPSYLTSLYKYIKGNVLYCNISIQGNYGESNGELESITLIMPDDVNGNHVDSITLTFNRDIIFGDNPFDRSLGVYLAAAIVSAPADGCSFNNIYWTYLNPVGVLKVHESAVESE